MKLEKCEMANAKITSTMLGIEDHGILTAMIQLDYGSSSQGFGGFMFDMSRGKGPRKGLPFAAEFIRSLLDTLEVNDWESLKGKVVRVRRGQDWNSKIVAIGHIIKDQWCDPEVIWARNQKRKKAQ